jgi:hypothetical protein
MVNDPSQSQPQKQDQAPKQDTKEEITKRVNELKETIFKSMEGDRKDESDKDDKNKNVERGREAEANLHLIERLNQIFNDALASIPPDVQEPKYQRATIATTMTKIREQAEAAIKNASTKQEHADSLVQPIKDAEEKAKKEDEEKGTQQPAGPSQSPQNYQPAQPVQTNWPEQPPQQQPQQPPYYPPR